MKNRILDEEIPEEKDIMEYNQEAKHDGGKLALSLVPRQIIEAIAKVRMYGVEKYHDPDNWKRVERERYKEALLRHVLAVWDDIDSADDESGLPHLYHIATNVAFLIAMEEGKHCCENCKYYIRKMERCTNSKSDHMADAVAVNFVCDEWVIEEDE